MNKYINPLANEELARQCEGRVWNFFDSSRGLIKAAASDAFSESFIRQNLPDDDHWGVHQIIMGASDYYGFNKNGDHWAESDLIKRGGTFVTHGHMFREHRNDDPKFSIGTIKAAAYNHAMHRLELIAHGHKKKAEAEYEKAKAGKGLTFSMAAKVPYDVCSCCDKKSASSKHYCPHAKYAMTRYLPQFKKYAFVRNPNPTFFDDSVVENPADVIAHFLSFKFSDDELKKEASLEGKEFPFFSDVLARAAGIPDEIVKAASDETLRSLIQSLAELEDEVRLSRNSHKEHFFKLAMSLKHPGLKDTELNRLRQLPPDVLWFELSKRAAVLPFLDFAALALKTTKADAAMQEDVKQARALIPRVYRLLCDTPADPNMEDLALPSSMFKAATTVSPCDPVQQLLDKVEPGLSVQPSMVVIRVTQGKMEPEESTECGCDMPKMASEKAKYLACMYGLYKAGSLLTMRHLHGSNFVDDKHKLLLISTR